MINEATVKGFKSLKDVEFDLGNLNILVGANASGKSSFLQVLLLLRQSSTAEGVVPSLQLSGDLFEGGTATDVLHPEAERKIEVVIREGRDATSFVFEALRSDADPNPRVLSCGATSDSKLPKGLYQRGGAFCYLNAERLGPRVSYPLPPAEAKLSGFLGKHGEFTTAFLARAHASNLTVPGWDSQLNALAAVGEGIDQADISFAQSQMSAVANILLAWVIPGASFDASEHSAMDMAQLGFTRDAKGTKSSVRPTHIGFGLSYTLPIITGLLATPKSGMCIVENPEAHLHPFSQSRMGSLLAAAAGNGIQLFVETHSDHVVNGVRLAVKNKLIDASDVRIFFFEKDPDSDSTSLTTLKVDQDGALSDWPTGFFDQIEIDLSRL
ncbi:DUF3696 domain-containing protein [Burkholderia cepacia]|uniref:AAA family ATPase n=1 Tax=Burkholderia cepacia TaxID=292 RepID=UPI00249DC4E1|nr:DUF3696 domain-containing protein [Burkholderia cepacia]WGY68626.1 DUF3696 domain-containing protein [Burkholderia cepacia]